MGTIEVNKRHAERDIRFAKLRTPHEDGPQSRNGLRMLVEMSANDPHAHDGTFDCLEMRRDIIDEGVRRPNFQHPIPSDLNEVLDMDLLEARCDLEAFHLDAEGGNRPFSPGHGRATDAALTFGAASGRSACKTTRGSPLLPSARSGPVARSER